MGWFWLCQIKFASLPQGLCNIVITPPGLCNIVITPPPGLFNIVINPPPPLAVIFLEFSLSTVLNSEPLIEQSEVIPTQWILSWKFRYLTGHLQSQFKHVVFQVFSLSWKWSHKIGSLRDPVPTYWSTSFTKICLTRKVDRQGNCE